MKTMEAGKNKKTFVHFSKTKIQALEDFILENATGHRTSFQISDVKRDGTVFVRFRSTPHESCVPVASRFMFSMSESNRSFVLSETGGGSIQIRVDISTF